MDNKQAWLPINTAPRHKDVLVWADGCGAPLMAQLTHAADFLFTVGEIEGMSEEEQELWTEEELWRECWWYYWADGARRMEDDCGNPTLWMPLPESPNDLSASDRQ